MPAAPPGWFASAVNAVDVSRAMQAEVASVRQELDAAKAEARAARSALDALRGERNAAHAAELDAKARLDAVQEELKQVQAENERLKARLRDDAEAAKAEAATLRSQLECAPPACLLRVAVLGLLCGSAWVLESSKSCQ
jgi:uncharacterized coiled-coil DUF342 family protein